MMCAFPPKGGCIAPPIIHAMSRFMALSFAVHRSRSGAKRSPFKAKLNVSLRQSQIGEVASSETTFRDGYVREFRLACGVHSTSYTNEGLIKGASHEDYPARIPLSLRDHSRRASHVEVRAGADPGRAEADPGPAKRLGESGSTGPGDRRQ